MGSRERGIIVAACLAVGMLVPGGIFSAAAQNEQSMSARSGAKTGRRMMRPSPSDRRFMMMAAMGGMTEVEAGRLAAAQGASDQVKQFGQRLVEDHTKANMELTQLAQSKGVTLPKELDAKHRAIITKLSRLSGAEFDRRFIAEMHKDHKKDVAMFQKQSEQGADADADVKAFAAKILPTLQEHLRMVESVHGGHQTTSGMKN